jgi:hypothetical protein
MFGRVTVIGLFDDKLLAVRVVWYKYNMYVTLLVVKSSFFKATE